MVLALLLLLIWPIAELYVAVKVAEAIGVLETILLLLAGWPVGWWALRSRGSSAWRRLRAASAVGRPPAREVVDGALVLIGGALIIVPGFISDAIGVILLLPLTRAPLRAVALRNVESRFVVRLARVPRRRYDVDSTARDLDQPRLHP